MSVTGDRSMITNLCVRGGWVSGWVRGGTHSARVGRRPARVAARLPRLPAAPAHLMCSPADSTRFLLTATFSRMKSQMAFEFAKYCGVGGVGGTSGARVWAGS